MEELKIYTSEGRRFDEEGTGVETKKRISNFFFGNVRLAIEFTRRTSTAWVFFWAREDRSSRSNQYYAEYTNDSMADFFRNMKQAIVQRVENELGMILDTSKDAVEVFNQMDRPIREFRDSSPGNFITKFINESQPLDFGTNDFRTAIGVCKLFYEQKRNGKLAICDNGRFDSIANYDLVIEYDSQFDDIEAVGETKELEEEKREELRKEQINNSLSKIESEIRTLRNEVGVSESEIRNRLNNRLPRLIQQSRDHSDLSETSTLEDPARDSTPQYSGRDSPLSTSNRSGLIPDLSLPSLSYPAIGGLLAVIILLFVLLSITGWVNLGFLIPSTAILPLGGPAPVTIDQPANDTTINHATFFINGTTKYDEVYVRIKDNEGNVTGAGYFQTEVRGGGQGVFNLTVGQGSDVDIKLSKSGNYVVEIAPIKGTDDEGNRQAAKSVQRWIEYKPNRSK